MSVKVRRATSDDASALVTLNRAFDSQGKIATDVAYVTSLIAESPTERVLIAEFGNEPVGFATIQVTRSFCYDYPTAEITGIYVSPDYRRAGIASKLLACAKQVAEAEHALELFLRVNHANTNAIAFYEAQGMEQAEHYVYRYRYY